VFPTKRLCATSNLLACYILRPSSHHEFYYLNVCQRLCVDYSCISCFVGQTMTGIGITFTVNFYINFFSPVASFLVNFCAETQMYHQLINTCHENLKTYAAPLVACRLLSVIRPSCTPLGLLKSPSRTFSTARCRGFPSHGLKATALIPFLSNPLYFKIFYIASS
jgi:hypothetical protein